MILSKFTLEKRPTLDCFGGGGSYNGIPMEFCGRTCKYASKGNIGGIYTKSL